MGILDRFKTQPKWKSTDPTVRAAGVQEISEDEQELLASIARTDDDPRVRRAAVSKLGTVAVLADAVRSDADEGVRDEAAGVLLDIALGAYEADEPPAVPPSRRWRTCRGRRRRSTCCSSRRRRSAKA